MAKAKVYKCGFCHCQHESCEISQDEAVKIRNRYFHKDCAETYNNIEEIKRLYYEKMISFLKSMSILTIYYLR